MNLEDRTKKALKEIKRPSIYFGHPVNIYNTLLEEYLINKIENFMPYMNIYNPNIPDNEENYKIWRKDTGVGMNFYYDIILPNMDKGIFLPFKDGMFGAGVWNEANHLLKDKKQIFSINENGLIQQIFSLNKNLCLSIEDTRKRVYDSF